MKEIKINEILKKDKIKKNTIIKGWIKTKRTSKNISFLEINDGSCLKNIQIIAEKKLKNYDLIKKSTIGSGITIKGKITKSKGAKQEIEIVANKIEIIQNADEKYPLQKKHQTNEFLRNIAHLRMRTNKYGAIFRVRSNLFIDIHNFFKKKNFLCVNTPIITSSNCEGAGNLFEITTRKKKNADSKKNINEKYNFFKKKVNLTVSGQLPLEMFALSYGNVYTFGPTFRAENSNTSKHAAEFWMLEPEMAFYDLKKTIHFSEKLIKHLIKKTISKSKEDLNYLYKKNKKNLFKHLEKIANSKFYKITYSETIKTLKKYSKKFKFTPTYGKDIKSEHEHFITEHYFNSPVFIINYPKEIKPFYMKLNNNEKTVKAVDLIMPKIGELIGGSQREDCSKILKKRMKELSISEKEYWWYIDSRKYGSVTHSGFGMGFERLIMLITGITNIRDVIPFPRTVGNTDF